MPHHLSTAERCARGLLILRPTLWQALQYPNQETEAQRMRVTPPPPRPQASELGRGGHQELNRGMSESRAWSRLRTADSPSLEWRRPWRRSPIPVGKVLTTGLPRRSPRSSLSGDTGSSSTLCSWRASTGNTGGGDPSYLYRHSRKCFNLEM